jgi:hypothetical protein
MKDVNAYDVIWKHHQPKSLGPDALKYISVGFIFVD